MRFTSSLSAALCFAVLLLAADSRAQDPGGTPNQPPPGSGTPNQPPPGSGTPNQPPPNMPPTGPLPAPGVAPGTPGTAPPPGVAPAPAPGEVEPKDEGRLRIGFNANGGFGKGGDYVGPALSLTFRIGWQLNKLMGIYGQITSLGWIALTDKTINGKSVDAAAVGAFQFTPMFSLTPVDLFEVALGPSADRMNGGSSSTTAGINNGTISGDTKLTVYSGFYFGVHGRAALHIGGKPNTTTGRRVSFTIALDIHPTFAEGSAITFYTIGLGADWY